MGGPYLACPLGTLSCDLSHDAFDVTYPLVNRQTDVADDQRKSALIRFKLLVLEFVHETNGTF